MNFSRQNGLILAVIAAIGLGAAIVTTGFWGAVAAPDAIEGNSEAEAQAAKIEQNATPMAQRIATIGFLNKRNGVARDFQMKPGDNLKVADDVIIRLRACDKTAPWETAPYTGAFIQVDIANAAGRWERVFSGWLYKESPSLNVVEHPIYDVWVKECQMSHGEPAAARESKTPESMAHASKAKKSPVGASPLPAASQPEAPATASANSAE